MTEVITRIQLKDKYVIDTRRPPAIRIDAKQEDEQDDEKYSTVHTERWVPADTGRRHPVTH